MYQKTCPTCNGEGTVWLSGFADTKGDRRWDDAGKTCHCDGPAHGYNPSWCKEWKP